MVATLPPELPAAPGAPLGATMSTGSDVALFDLHTLADALSIGLEIAEEFGDDFSAVWLGDDDGLGIDFVVCAHEAAPDVDHLARYAAIGAPLLEASRVVLWTSDDDLTDGPRLADDYFLHRDMLSDAGATLVDEIVIGDEELRSMAITTFTDEPGWDDVSHRIDLGSR
jgi:hypothetical protein